MILDLLEKLGVSPLTVVLLAAVLTYGIVRGSLAWLVEATRSRRSSTEASVIDSPPTGDLKPYHERTGL